MKEEYRQPTVKVLIIKPRTTVLTGSYGDGIEGTNIEEEPGGEGAFG